MRNNVNLAANMPSHVSVGGASTEELTRSSHLSEAEQSTRRKQIKEIMSDASIGQQEKNRLIQGLMDGRRRSSMGSSVSRSVYSGAAEQEQHNYVNNMAAAAAAATGYHSFSSHHDGEDVVMSETPENIYDYNHHDNRSVASSISHTSNYDGPNLLSEVRGSGVGETTAGRGAQNTSIPGGQYRQLHGRSFSLQDWNEESRATATANVNSLFAGNPEQASRLMELSRPVCSHYKRNCTIIAPCCGLAFGCRICHDECPVLPPPINTRKRRAAGLLVADQVVQQAGAQKHERRRSMPLENETYYDDEEENHHLIDRFAIREVICRHCYTRQSSKTNNCKACGIQFGEYHCSICNLWMSDAESPYHCTECGFCRVGGRENFRHCRDCGMCIDTLQFDNHNCKAGKYNSKCPVCQEDLFSSREAAHEMPCGHAIHWHCFKELTSFDTRCPVCKKTAETPEQMASTWSALAMGIALQPVPRDMARVVNIICNDCGERDYERRWHFLGVRCMHCLSFNTNIDQIILHGPEAEDFLDTQEAARAEETGGVPPTISALPFAASSQSSSINNNNIDNLRNNDDDVMFDAEEDGLVPGGVDTSSGTYSTDLRPRPT